MSARSSPVKTASTSGRSFAIDVLIDVIRACASGDRTTAAYSVPGSCRSST
jgi:hypothetical protein